MSTMAASLNIYKKTMLITLSIAKKSPGKKKIPAIFTKNRAYMLELHSEKKHSVLLF